MKYYCGVGSRETPEEICDLMSQIAVKLESQNYILRSGGADGADWAFQKAISKAEIWLPWKTFNSDYQRQKPEHDYRLINNDQEAEESLKFHPRFPNLKDSVKCMMRRNFRQVVGLNEENSLFIICWTSDGKASGGTGQAIRIAESKNIPVFNLHDPVICSRLNKFVKL